MLTLRTEKFLEMTHFDKLRLTEIVLYILNKTISVPLKLGRIKY